MIHINTIEFEIIVAENKPFLEIFHILIDGISLVDRLNTFDGASGNFGPIKIPKRPKFYFLGYRDKNDEHRGKKQIADCSCACFGCDPLSCKITLKDEVVIWSEFFDPLFSASSIKPFDDFTFEVNQYHDALTLFEREVSKFSTLSFAERQARYSQVLI